MTFQVSLSQLQAFNITQDQFQSAVISHIAALHAFAKVKGKPRPVAHPFVEGAVMRTQAKGKPDTYSPDYQIVDDLPKPPEKAKEPDVVEEVKALNLEQKKQVLTQQVLAAESVAKQKIMPTRKLRLVVHMATLAHRKKDKGEEPTDDDKVAVAKLDQIMADFAAVELIAAKAESDIEDLTEDNIDSWQVPTI